MNTLDLYWEDLTPEAQQKVLDFLGDNGNFDVFPLCTITLEETEE